jgi:hypothetical protein
MHVSFVRKVELNHSLLLVGIALAYGLDYQVSIPGGGWEFFFSPLRPERLWSPPSLLSNGYQGLFPWGKVSGALKHRDDFTLPFTFTDTNDQIHFKLIFTFEAEWLQVLVRLPSKLGSNSGVYYLFLS